MNEWLSAPSGIGVGHLGTLQGRNSTRKALVRAVSSPRKSFLGKGVMESLEPAINTEEKLLVIYFSCTLIPYPTQFRFLWCRIFRKHTHFWLGHVYVFCFLHSVCRGRGCSLSYTNTHTHTLLGPAAPLICKFFSITIASAVLVNVSQLALWINVHVHLCLLYMLLMGGCFAYNLQIIKYLMLFITNFI